MSTVPPPTGDELRSAFDAADPLTIGVEEELMVLDPETLDLTPAAEELLALTGADPRFKRELPAAQVEIVTPPLRAVPEVAEALAAARRDLVEAAAGRWQFGGAGVHPFAAAEGVLNDHESYDDTRERYGRVARSQLVFALQVHVAVGGAERTLTVYNALRSYLPEIAALAANARWYEGRDSEFASVRPKIGEQLPRQGVPPRIESWDEFAAAMRWGADADLFEPRAWWWELRPRAHLGTLEVRVPDAQATVAESAGVAAFVHALIAWLVERHDGGDRLSDHPRWKIEENRWLAARDGVEGVLVDLDTGERRPARERLLALLEEIAPCALRVGADLAHARAMVETNGAVRLRRARDAHAAVRAIAAGFLG
ncbi:MAG TPA: YbdK family carboxylate-amine ligase [Thermoleophilaceae bacterium]|nr:YbdK family carboxylate-amine ligase [Thermoleophilaceae bacterium]